MTSAQTHNLAVAILEHSIGDLGPAWDSARGAVIRLNKGVDPNDLTHASYELVKAMSEYYGELSPSVEDTLEELIWVALDS